MQNHLFFPKTRFIKHITLRTYFLVFGYITSSLLNFFPNDWDRNECERRHIRTFSEAVCCNSHHALPIFALSSKYLHSIGPTATIPTYNNRWLVETRVISQESVSEMRDKTHSWLNTGCQVNPSMGYCIAYYKENLVRNAFRIVGRSQHVECNG